MAQKTIYAIGEIDPKGKLPLDTQNIIRKIGKNKKIINAILQFNQAIVAEADVISAICHDSKQIVDFITSGQKTFVVNVTHEINCILQNEKDSITFQFQNKAVQCYDIRLLVEYVPQQIMHQSNSYVDVDARSAGSGKINLATGNLQFESAGLVYNGWQANKEQIEVDDATDGTVSFDTRCGKGWKLGVQQHLVKRDSEDGEEVYTYVDGSGNYHEFVEKYYYLKADKKQHVNKKDVTVDLDGKLTYSGQEVKIERRSTNGLTLETDYSTFQYGHLIEQRQDEQIQLEERVDSYKRQLDEYVVVDKTDGRSLAELSNKALTQQNFDEFISKFEKNLLFTKSESIQYNSLLLQLTQKPTASNLADIGKTVSWNDKEKYKNIESKNTQPLITLRTRLQDLRTNLTQLTKKVNAAESGEDYQYEEYLKFLGNHPYKEDEECCMDYLDYLESLRETLKKYFHVDLNIGEEDTKDRVNIQNRHFKNNLCDLQNELDNLNVLVALCEPTSLDGNFKLRQKVLEQRIRAFQKEFNNKVESVQQKITELDDVINTYLEDEQNKLIDEQLALLLRNSDNNKADIQKYYKDYVNYKHQLDLLYTQLPTHFIVGGEATMGFNKFGCLTMLFDEYENQTAIIYEDGKITSVKDTDNNETSFEYNSQGLLSKIVDSNEKITSFTYDNEHNLTSISVDGEKIASFVYSYYDHNHNGSSCDLGELKSICDSNGYRIELIYSDGCKITEVREFTDIYSVSDGKVLRNSQAEAKTVVNVQYHASQQAATVTDSNGVMTTYIFDNLGKPVTVYEGEYDEGKTTKAVSLEYVDGKQSFAIEEKLKHENLINSAKLIHDTLSDGTQSSERIRSIRIDKSALKDGVTDYVFSAWAKANSAYIRDTRKTDCSFGTIDKETEQYLDDNQRNRKFELRAEVNYDIGEPDVYSASFDWLNEDYQYLALPVEIANSDKDGDKLPSAFPFKVGAPAREVVSIDLCVDYSFNTGDIVLGNMSFREGSWTYSTYDDNGNKITDEDSASKTKTTYYYDVDDRVVKAVAVDKLGREFTGTYEYNKQGNLVRSTNYAGVVEETVFDEKGRELKKIRYNVDDPTSKLYTESKRDDKGVITADVDESGEYDSTTYTYDHTGEATVQTDGKGNKTAFGYKDGQLVSISGSADGEEATNTMKYTADLLTKTSNGDTDYNFTYDGWGRTTKVEVAGETYLDVEHVSDLETVTKLANGQTIVATKDKYGNLLEQTSKYGQVEQKITNTYNDEKQLVHTQVDNKEETEYTVSYEYDVNGNVVSVVRDGEFALTKDYAYTADGDLERTEYNVDGQILAYEFETDGTPDKRNAKVQLPFDVEQNFAYDGLGRTKEISLGDHLVKDVYYAKYGDHATNRVSSVWYGVNGLRKENTRYTYDKAGNIETVTDNGKLVARYFYDGLNRLVREDNIYLGTFTYSYDHAGNILCRTAYPFTLDDTITAEGTDFAYEYKQHGWKDQLTSFNGEICADYDALGNPKIYKGRRLTWQGRRLLSYKNGDNSAEFTYDANGVRTSKTVTLDGASTHSKFIFDENKLIAEQIAGNGSIYYVYGVDGVAGFKYQDTTYLFRKNLQGDVTHIYTAEGTLVAQYVYDAWGNCEILLDTNGIAELNPFRYRGYYYDQESGLYYLQSRYYDPQTGRFISADSIDYLDPETLGGLNLYAYCNNNPVMAVDETGSSWKSFWQSVGDFFKKSWDVVVGTLISAALIIGGIAVIVFSGGSLLTLGSAMIGAGIGGFIGGLQSKQNGGSYWAGYLGGALIGAAVGAGVGFGLGLLAETSFMFTLPSLGGIFGTTAIATAGVTVTITGADILVGTAVVLGSYVLYKEHTKNKRKSNLEKHQKGQARKNRDKFGGEKGDERRTPRYPKRKGHLILFSSIIGFIYKLLNIKGDNYD